MSKHRKYKQAFRVACQLAFGDYLYGYDKDIIFEEIMKKNGVVSSALFEKFILEHLDELRGVDSEVMK